MLVFGLTGAGAAAHEPLPAHESFTVESAALKETRRINVYTPPGYAGAEASPGAEATRFPVLYMPDGGLREDFPHVAETVDAAIKAGEMRPMIVVEWRGAGEEGWRAPQGETGPA